METILSILGFTTLESTLWNLGSYVAVVGLIIALFIEKNDRLRISLFFMFGGVVLGFYAAFFLHDVLFTTLQVIVGGSALFRLLKFEPRTARTSLGLLTVGAIIFLALSGNLNNVLNIVGTLGFLSIAAGIILLPWYVAFPIMAAGGGFLVGYAWETAAWVFFILNIAFVFSNIIQWYRLKPRSQNLGS